MHRAAVGRCGVRGQGIRQRRGLVEAGEVKKGPHSPPIDSRGKGGLCQNYGKNMLAGEKQGLAGPIIQLYVGVSCICIATPPYLFNGEKLH